MTRGSRVPLRFMLGCYTAYDRTKDTNWLVPAEFTAKGTDPWAECDCLGHANAYRAVCRPSPGTVWNASTNDWFNDGWFEQCVSGSTISASTDRITARTNRKLTYTTENVVVVSDRHGGLNKIIIPAS